MAAKNRLDMQNHRPIPKKQVPECCGTCLSYAGAYDGAGEECEHFLISHRVCYPTWSFWICDLYEEDPDAK